MAPRLVILYEDSPGPLQRFPLHDLVVKSAADLVPLDLHELFRRVIAVPKRGVSKVLDEVARCDRFLTKHARLLVWVDNDAVRRVLSLARDCARGTVISTIKARAPQRGDGSRPKPLEGFSSTTTSKICCRVSAISWSRRWSQRQTPSDWTRATSCSTRSAAVDGSAPRCAASPPYRIRLRVAIRGVCRGHGSLAGTAVVTARVTRAG